MEHTKTKQNVAIVCGGEISDFVWFKEQMKKYSYIIAADSGYDKLVACSLKPDIVIGDFDSTSLDIPTELPRITYPIKKDKTDFMLALDYCGENGIFKADVYGALGGRIDHSLGAIFSVCEAIKQNVSATLITENCTAFVVNNYCEITRPKGPVSLFALETDAYGVTLRGFEYPLDNAILSCCSQLGVSNRIINDVGKISIENGTILVIIQN